ncbi:MAG TPA: ATP-binding protein [Gaiellaceae bacterium]|nr:ATP-binding protein [Gaiellaceae bacterium]
MSRLPIRLRLTLAFAAAMAVLLAGLAFLLLHHLAASLDRTLDQGLRARAADVSAIVQQSDTGLREAATSPVASSKSFAQILDRRGRIVDETRGLGSRPLLDARQLARARSAPLLVERTRRLGIDVRLLAVAVTAQDQHLVAVVGAPLAARDDAIVNLRRELLLGGPPALLATAVIAYLLAAAALRPVERMRARADTISERHLSERLPLPRARDELARLGQTLNAMLARIEAGVARERRFVADASHELRAPLALLRAEVELALEQRRPEPELRAALRSVGEEADRLAQLADDLLLLARLDEGRLPLHHERIDVVALLDAVVTRFERRSAEAHRPITVVPVPVRLEGDRLRLEQALANLLENALRHGGGAIDLYVRETDEAVELHVADHGPGFPDGFLPDAFARFSRADQARTEAGAGLGLAIVAEIAAAHGGTVGAVNRPGGGADVWLALPQAVTTSTPPEQAAAAAG